MREEPATRELEGALRELAREGDPLQSARILTSLRERLLGTPSSIRIGRYEIGPRIGQGGQGTVYRAFDPELSREVAIKMLGGRKIPTGPEEQQRLMREARALARLSHPNVIAVHDVGTFAEPLDPASVSVYIVMELIDGRTLRDFADGRTGDELLDVLMQAGRGLAAAHELGIVHRDFKPSNVLVDAKGRARVLDFGIALDTSSGSEPVDLAGTPAFMAPEQRKAMPDARSDQYAFCLTAREVLARFEIRTRGLSPEIDRILARGSAEEPGDRYPNMATLLAALERAASLPARRRVVRRLVISGLALAGLGAAAVWIVRPSADPCRQPSTEAWAEISSSARMKALSSALRATELPYAAHTVERVSELLGEYGDRWVETHERVCGNQQLAPAARISAAHCLEQRRQSANALLEALLAEPRRLAARAVEAVGRLESPEACEDAPIPGDASPPDPERARVSGLLAAGAIDDAEALIAQRLASERPDAWWHLAAARAAQERASTQEAVTHGRIAWAEGEREHDADTAVRALLLLARVAVVQGDLDEADTHLKVADARVSGSRTIANELAGLVQFQRGVLQAARGEWNAALQAFQNAFDASPEGDPKALHRRLMAMSAMGAAEGRLGHFERAVKHLQEVELLATVELGAMHPRAAEASTNLAAVLLMSGYAPEAVQAAQHSVRAHTALFGNHHPNTALALDSLGTALSMAGDPLGGLEAIDAALRIYEGSSPSADWMSFALQHRAFSLLGTGRPAEALASAREAVGTLERAHGQAHESLVDAVVVLAMAHASLGDHESSLAAWSRAHAIASRGQHDPRVPALWSQKALAFARLGRCREARDAITQSVSSGVENTSTPSDAQRWETIAIARSLCDDIVGARIALARARPIREGRIEQDPYALVLHELSACTWVHRSDRDAAAAAAVRARQAAASLGKASLGRAWGAAAIVNLGGGEDRDAVLEAMRRDFAVLETEDGVIQALITSANPVPAAPLRPPTDQAHGGSFARDRGLHRTR